jgi:glycosyltransferase involved in cell wall biosynthesis
MKLVIQIPCYNEEETLPMVVKDLPRRLAGVDAIQVLVIDDGSTDRTSEVARELGVDHVIALGTNQGYGMAFLRGMRKCMALGADIIVNTDGDNQYRGSSIEHLIAPIVQGRADIVIGSRPIEQMDDFSWIKKKLQRIGSRVARHFSRTDVPDAASGFRAYSADAAMRLHILSHYSHSLETIIQAGHMNLRITSVPVEVNPRTRESRLMTSMWQYVWRSASIILRSYIRHEPLRTFLYFSLVPAFFGLLICVRFLLYFLLAEKATGGIQSLILAAILLIIAFHLIALGILADLTRANRELIQEVLYLERSRIQEGNRREERD